MRAADFPEWLDATVAEDEEPAPPPGPSVFDDVTEISPDLQMLALVQAEPGPILIVHDVDDPAEEVRAFDPADDEQLPMLDAAEFEPIDSVVASIREPPIVHRLRLLFEDLHPSIARIQERLVRSKVPRLIEISNAAFDALRSVLPSSTAPPSTNDQDAMPLLAEQHSRQRIVTIAVWVAVALGVFAFGSRIVALFDY
jgi:hypothetical protein